MMKYLLSGRKKINELKNKKNLTIKHRTSLAAFHSYNYLLARENLADHKSLDKRSNKLRQRLWKIRAKKVILATGAIERPLIFNNNDRPGVMLANSVKKYIDYFGVRCGNKNIIFTNNDSAYETAISLNKKGINVTIVDIRNNSSSILVKKAQKMQV